MAKRAIRVRSRQFETRKYWKKILVSGVGFEPTPSFEDQNTSDPTIKASRIELESGALDRSAILTYKLDEFH